jgi:hypothetical protein
MVESSRRAMEDLAGSLRQLIYKRKTEKVLGNPDRPVHYEAGQLERGDRIVRQAIRDSGQAPFHYDRKADGLAEPWRAYWLDCDSCRILARSLPDLIPDLRPGNKMAALLAACGSLTLYTWLPQETDSGVAAEKLRQVNDEHLAATAAAVQNFLLLLTSHGIGNYWSSGSLIAGHLLERLGISGNERLLAAVFATYPGGSGDARTVHGKQRERRSRDHAWFREIRFGQES